MSGTKDLADLLRMGRLPEAWIGPPQTRELRELVRHRAKLVGLLDGVRRRLWTRILDLVGWEGAAVLAATHILHMLEIPIRHGRHDVVPGVVKRGYRALDELNALR